MSLKDGVLMNVIWLKDFLGDHMGTLKKTRYTFVYRSRSLLHKELMPKNQSKEMETLCQDHSASKNEIWLITDTLQGAQDVSPPPMIDGTNRTLSNVVKDSRKQCLKMRRGRIESKRRDIVKMHISNKRCVRLMKQPRPLLNRGMLRLIAMITKSQNKSHNLVDHQLSPK